MPFETWNKSFNVLLIQPDQGAFVRSRIFHPGVEIPLNLACLSAYLEANGIGTEILDLRLYEEPYAVLRRVLEDFRFSIIGISAYTSEIENAGRVAAAAKELCSAVPVVVGGYHASAVPEETLAGFPAFDCLIHGEGERSFLAFARRVLEGRPMTDLRGVVSRDGDAIRVNPREALIENLDELPLTARHKLDMAQYQPKPATGNFMQLPSTGIMSSRGCPFNCAYCSKGVWHRTVRFRSPQSVVAEIEHCLERYGIHDFRFYDDALTNPVWDLQRFCRLLLERGIRITWNCYSRVDHVHEEKLELMKEAGCYHIKYGVEFGTEKALKLARKGTTLEQARRAIAETKRTGIECKASFIFGVPGETLEDCRKTLAFALELSPDLASFYPFDLFPGSHFHREARQAGTDRPPGTLPRDVTERLTRTAYYRFYFRPRYIGQRGKRLFLYPKREFVVLSNGLKMMGKFLVKSVTRKERI